jgi:hypothetical protein
MLGTEGWMSQSIVPGNKRVMAFSPAVFFCREGPPLDARTQASWMKVFGSLFSKRECCSFLEQAPIDFHPPAALFE